MMDSLIKIEKICHLVTIVTPSYNCSDFISKTIDSVINQSYSNWEMIIVDDKSTDNTVEIINNYVKKDNRIKLIESADNYGPAYTRNIGIKYSKGAYIAFLDSDDLWEKDKLLLQVSFMKKNDIPFSYSGYSIIDEAGKKITEFYPRLKVNYRDLLKTNDIGCLTAIYDVSKLGKMYMENLKTGQDLTLWLKILKKIGYGYCIEMSLARYRIRDGSNSRKKTNKAKWQWYTFRVVEALTISKSIYYFVFYTLYGIRNSLKIKNGFQNESRRTIN